ITSAQPTTASPLSLHDALPICTQSRQTASAISGSAPSKGLAGFGRDPGLRGRLPTAFPRAVYRPSSTIALDACGSSRTTEFHRRSEEHTSELQSRENLVCRLLL